jgi:hypothetical protein
MTSTSGPAGRDGTADEPPEPTGFRWYLRSSLPLSWLAKDFMPALEYLRETEQMPVVNIRRGWLHGAHLEVIANSHDGRPVPWPQVIVRLRAPREETSVPYAEEGYLSRARELGRLEQQPGPYLPYRPHGTFEWLATSDLQRWPGSAQLLRERALTWMFDSLAVTLALGGAASSGEADPLTMVAEIMLAVADAHPLRIPHGAFFYRSLAEAFLRRSLPAADPLAEFRRGLAGDASTLQPLVKRMLAGGDTRSSASWRRTAAYCMGLFDSAVLASELTPRALDEMSDTPGVALPAGIGEQPPGWLPSYQLLLNLLYAQLPLLGVSPSQYYYLCWALAEIVDDVTGLARRSARLLDRRGICEVGLCGDMQGLKVQGSIARIASIIAIPILFGRYGSAVGGGRSRRGGGSGPVPHRAGKF